MRLTGGETKVVRHRAYVTFGADGEPVTATGILVDVTGEHRMREKLDEVSATLTAVWDHALQGFLLIDSISGSIVGANPSAEVLLGQPETALVGRHIMSIFALEHRKDAVALFTRGVRGAVQQSESGIVGARSARIAVELSRGPAFAVGGRTLILATFRDSTLRKRHERERASLARTIAATVRAVAATIRAGSVEALLQSVCDALVGGAICAACIVMPEGGAGHRRADLARAGLSARYLEDAGESVRSRPAFAVPIVDAERFLALAVYREDGEEFGADEIALFTTLGEEVELALRALRARDRHLDAESRERRRASEVSAALEGALGALSSTLEKRDPGTSGHQRRVAALTKLITAEMRFDVQRAPGVHVAALVHDIGKIAVPPELLSKPGPLTASEYAVVKQHVGAGYDIMRQVPFPWPVAEIVRQHHEYLDGSGYPRGLKGDEILMETRILTVADIVEAMTSLRSYRVAADSDAVIAHLRRLAGTKLDPAVVEACARIVDRGDFVFPVAGG